MNSQQKQATQLPIDQINIALTLIQRNHEAHADAASQLGGNAISTVITNMELGRYGVQSIDRRSPFSEIDADYKKNQALAAEWAQNKFKKQIKCSLYHGTKSF